MQFLKKTLIAFLAFTLILQPTFAAFRDIAADDSYSEAAQFLEDHGISAGKNNFYPKRPITLSEFLVFAFTAAGVEKSDLKQTQTRFTDVPSEAWFAPYVAEADRFGALGGLGETRLTPNRALRRGEAAKLGLQIFGVSVSRDILLEEFGFRDVQSNYALAPFIFKAAKIGALDPISDGRFGALSPLTRGEAAEFVYRLSQFQESGSTTIILQGGSASNVPGIELLETVWNEIENKFIFTEDIDEEAMLHGAVQGAVDALGDPYSVFLPPDKSSAFSDDLSGELEGIGAYLSQDEETNEIKVVAPIRGSPAESVGVKAGDIITAVNGENIKGLTITEVANRIKGPRGTQVKITVKRAGREFSYLITRAKVEVHSVELEYQNNVAIIHLSQFTATTSNEFAKAADEIKSKQPAGIILDLRNDPGGLFNAAIDVLGYFLPTGSIAAKAKYRNSAAGENEAYKTTGDDSLGGYRVAVLVNEGSASASEIVAAALQDHDVGTIVGTKTFGKGTVQELSFFRDGTALKLTVAHWLSPKEQPINKHGVDPDIQIIDDETTTADEVLARALQLF
jgi:carboxyl-terminal processing protease